MYYIRQLMIKCKKASYQESILDEIKKLTKIECIHKSIIMKGINTNTYDYINKDFDYSVMFYFKEYESIQKYCSHPLHLEFIGKILDDINIVVYDYCIEDSKS